MKIIDLKCAIIGQNPVVRIVTDEGIDGIGAAESSKPYLKPMVMFYKDMILGKDPTDVEQVMLFIRRMGAFKPWGSAVSAIEMALWDGDGAMTHDDQMRSLRLMGEYVIPAVREIGDELELNSPFEVSPSTGEALFATPTDPIVKM